MRKVLLSWAFALFSSASLAYGSITINEIRVDNPGGDINEYFELAGNPGESLAGLTYVVIGDPGHGSIEVAAALSGAIPADGYFLGAETTLGLGGVVDQSFGATGLDFENDDRYTHMIVSGFTGSVADDLDTNDDGVLDVTPWTSIIDSVAFIGEGSDQIYTATTVGPDPIKGSPWHILRLPNGNGPWTFDSLDNGGANTDPANYLTDTPGAANVPEPATLVLVAMGGLAIVRRRS